jgi:hypothetical protein
MLPRVRDDERAVSAKKNRTWRDFVPPLGLAAALVGTVEFGRGAVNVIFIVSSAVSGFLVCVWLLHLFRAQLNAVVPPPKAGQPAEQRREKAREGRVLPGTRALVILAAGVPAAVLMQLSDRAGGAGHPLAAGLLAVSVLILGVATELGFRNRWRWKPILTMDGAMITADASYPAAARRAVAAASKATTGVGGASTTAAGVLVVALALNGFADRGNQLQPLAGKWAIGRLETVRTNVGSGFATPVVGQTWTFSPRRGCNSFRCSYTVRADDLNRFVLHPVARYVWVGVSQNKADCVDDPPSDKVVVANGYNEADLVRFSLNPDDGRYASVEDNITYVTNSLGRLPRYGCPRTRYRDTVGSAARYLAAGKPSTAQGSTGAASAASTNAATTTATTATTSTIAPSHHLSGQVLRADDALKNFVGVTFNQPVRCNDTASLTAGATAQLGCSIFGVRLVATRLKSLAVTHGFMKLRFRQAYPFSGQTRKCSSGTVIGTWSDGTGVERGYWGIRQIGSEVKVLWDYDDANVALVATGSRKEALRVCDVWYNQSG